MLENKKKTNFCKGLVVEMLEVQKSGKIGLDHLPKKQQELKKTLPFGRRIFRTC